MNRKISITMPKIPLANTNVMVENLKEEKSTNTGYWRLS